MKKLAIFLILFIFSISAFAQDKSLYAENFSLIKHSRAINRIFFKPEISLPVFGVATTGKRIQNWTDLYNLRIGQQEDMSSEEESLALGYLKRLERRTKAGRKTWGTVWLVGGGAFMVIGFGALSSADDVGGWEGFGRALGGAIAMTSGAVMSGIGIYRLAIRSGAEKELEDVLSISDPGHRERASSEALSSLAARGRRGRILWGILWSVYFLSALISEEEGGSLVAAYYGGFALYNFMRKSRAERAFQNYLKEKEFQNRLEFRLGIMPHGGVKVGFVYSF
jgi:hypothetical protein